MRDEPEPARIKLVERSGPHAADQDQQGRGIEQADVLSAGTILVADGAFDVLVGAALLAGTVASATRPLGAGSLRPWPLFVAIGVGCLAFSALLFAASTGPGAKAFCRSIWLANVLTSAACVALLLAFPHLAHLYVVTLAVVGVGCAVFASFEWTAGRQP